MRRDYHLRLEAFDDAVPVFVAEDVLRTVDRQSEHIHLSPSLPDIIRRIVTVVAPDEYPHSCNIDCICDHVHMTWIFRRAGLDAKLGQGIGPLVPTGGLAGMLVGD